MWDCTSVLKRGRKKNRSGIVKRTMNREGDGERLDEGNARAGGGGSTPGSDLMGSGVEQLERRRLPFSRHAHTLTTSIQP